MNAIEIEGLGKRYLLGTEPHPDRVADAIGRRLWMRRTRAESFWALRGVDLDIACGEAIGLIGSNGAGKSTLLKILSRIVAPTEGRAIVRGRVGSLLEVGTGFHGELTGRENAILSGAILGMSRHRVLSLLDEIVDFSEVGAFLDTPVKRYSSGMFMRLAFAVAAFLDTEILLVDEVLAVGDISFQRRCLGKMDEASRSGRTVVFVSHNLGSIAQLCSRVVWLDQGAVRGSGPAAEVVRDYMTAHQEAGRGEAVWRRHEVEQTGSAQVIEAGLGTASLGFGSPISSDETLLVTLVVNIHRPESGMSAAFYLRNSSGVVVVSSDVTHSDPSAGDELVPGLHEFTVELPRQLLAPDDYWLSAFIRSAYHGDVDSAVDVCRVAVVDTETVAGARRAGVVGYRLPWHHRVLSSNPISESERD